MKKIICIISFISICFAAFSQDTIYTFNNQKIQAKVIEINQISVRYKNFTNPDGPDYVLNREDIIMIVYKNGQVEVLANKVPSKYKKQKDKDFYKRNIIALHLLDFLINNFTMSYEHISKNGYLGLKIPLSFNLNPSDNKSFDIVDFNNYKTFSSGIDLNIYPTGQGLVKYFLGSSLNIGSYTQKYNYNYPAKLKGYYTFLFNNGISFNPAKHINLSLTMGWGIINEFPNGYDNVQATINLGFNLGYTFNFHKITTPIKP